MGSLVAAVASYLEARARKGEWMLRIEDIDPPREIPGSADRILLALETFGFEWDGDVLYQSTRTGAYEQAVHKLRKDDMAFGCACSRSDVAGNGKRVGPEGPVYPGTCRAGVPAGRHERSVRLKVADAEICFDDRLQGRTCQNIAKDIGDFVIRRADGCYAYQLAVVIDDAAQGITDVVRGADLLLSTPRQILLQHRLGLPSPGYLHIPLLLDEFGTKLSKQNRSLPVDLRRPGSGLFDALCLLQQAPPAEIAASGPAEIWAWAAENWDPQRLRGLHNLFTPSRP